jgi:hypothetical protein
MLFTEQFILLFLGFKAGKMADVGSVTQQPGLLYHPPRCMFLRGVPSLRQCIGTVMAIAALAAIGR